MSVGRYQICRIELADFVHPVHSGGRILTIYNLRGSIICARQGFC
jgi:hypothetical protein